MRGQRRKGCEWLAWAKGTVPTYPRVSRGFCPPSNAHPFISLRSEFHDKCEPCNDDWSSCCRYATPCYSLPRADPPAICRTDGEGLWSRFLGADRSDPLYLEHRSSRAEP